MGKIQKKILPAWELDKSIPQRFAQIVAILPDHMAFVSAQLTMTYRDFDNLSNHLATKLLEVLGPGHMRVGLVLNSGAHLYIAALAALKANKCFVPLDPVQPVARLQEYVERTQAACLITDDTYRDTAEKVNQSNLPLLDVIQGEKSGCASVPELKVDPDSEAYIIMTSGSTGAPKGVRHGHRGSLHNAMVTSEEFGLSVGDQFLTLFTPAVFGAQRDFMLGVSAGITMHHIPVREEGFAVVAGYIEKHRIICFTSVLTMMRRFLDTLKGDEDLTSIRLFTAGGEPVQWSDVRRMYEHFPAESRFRSNLTMSESNIITLTWLTKDMANQEGRIPLGAPTRDKQVELRKQDGTLAGPGEVGEVYVRSKYISLGYLDAPEEVASRFQHHEDGTRTFATGDLAKLEEDGNLYIVGRADHQVKLRGYRVDLSEVEMTLLQHPDVAEGVVKVHQAEGKQDQLVAYVRMRNEGSFSVRGLRDFLAGKLSSYALPTHFVLMQHIPQTASGKVHRQALEMPEEVSREGLEAKAEPRNELDEWLVGVWESWIGIHGIGIDDDFFEVGGDSLSATQLLMQVDEEFDAELDAEAILNSCNTVRKMSDHLAGLAKKKPNAAQEIEKRDALDINFVEGNQGFENTNRPELYRLDKKTGLRVGKPGVQVGKIKLNNLGFRGPDLDPVKPGNRLRLAFLGSSTVFDPVVSSNEHTWPHLLVQNLQDHFPDQEFDYVNAALPGYNSRRSKVLFDNFVDQLSPDIVIVQTGDMNLDANMEARAQGLFDGVAYRPSSLAKKSGLVRLVEKNIVLLLRQIRTLLPGRHLEIMDDIAKGFEERMGELLKSCKGDDRLVIVLECQRLRKSQTLLQKIRSLSSYCLYMPYMSLKGFLRGQEIYGAARRRVTEESGGLYFDLTEQVPADSQHFADSSHFRDKGSEVFANLVADRLAERQEFSKRVNRT